MPESREFDSGVAGCRLLVLGAVHGNEVAGVFACRRIIENIENGKIKLLKGRLTLVLVANPKAYEADVRQIDENLNRVVNKWDNPDTYEKKLGVELAKYIDQCDYMLDIHSTHNEGELPFSFLDYKSEGNLKIVEAMDVEYVLEGWPEVYGSQEAIKDFSTESYAHIAGKNGITLEAGYHKDEKAVETAYNSALNLMCSLGMIDGSCKIKNKKIIRMTKVVVKEKDGRLCYNFKHLDFVRKGTIIATYESGEKFAAERDCYIIIPNHEAERGAEWYYLGEEY